MLRTWSTIGVVALFGASASAHFVWIDAKEKDGKTTFVAGFGEPGEWDASLAGKIKAAKYWSKTRDGKEPPATAAFDEKEGVYRLEIAGFPASVVGACEYGVVSLAKNPPTLDEWKAIAREFPGSWWHDWDKWLSEKSGPKVAVRVPGEGGLPAIEDAPGSYVKVRTID